MRFNLLFLPAGKNPCVMSASAYVCLGENSKLGEDCRDPRYGYIMLTSECVGEAECHREIDYLIDELKKLKHVASRKFRM
jgi:hypothetical protein